MTRRDFIPAAASAAALAAAPLAKGRLKQCVTAGVFRGRQMSLDDMARESAALGIYGFDLVAPQDWPILQKHGLVPTMTGPPYCGTINDGINKKENHDRFEKSTHEIIDLAAKANCPNVIALAGTRKGKPDEESAENCVAFLNKVKKHAEDQKIVLCLELLNSKVNHPDYVCDHTAWGVGVMKQVGSPNVKLLYDIYHMQIMEGDIARTIRDNFQYIGHFHTGGNPGRHEIDQTQELNYHFVAGAIADLGYTGCVAHEYTPVRDPLTSLREAIQIFTV